MPLRGLGRDKHQLVSVEIDSSLVGTFYYIRNMMSTQIKIRLTQQKAGLTKVEFSQKQGSDQI